MQSLSAAWEDMVVGSVAGLKNCDAAGMLCVSVGCPEPPSLVASSSRDAWTTKEGAGAKDKSAASGSVAGLGAATSSGTKFSASMAMGFGETSDDSGTDASWILCLAAFLKRCLFG